MPRSGAARPRAAHGPWPALALPPLALPTAQTFGEHVKSDLWLSYTEVVPTDLFVTVCRACFLVAILCTVPVIFFPMRKTLFSLLCPTAPFRWSTHTAVTVVLVGSLLGIAILVPEIKAVFSVVGATSSVLLVFVLPASIFLRTVPPEEARCARRAFAWLLLAVGPCVAAVALVAFFTK